MKKASLFLCFLLSGLLQAQTDSTTAVEPDQQTSYDNQDLLLISLAGLALLIAIYFLFRRTRRTKN